MCSHHWLHSGFQIHEIHKMLHYYDNASMKNKYGSELFRIMLMSLKIIDDTKKKKDGQNTVNVTRMLNFIKISLREISKHAITNNITI